MIRKLLLVWIGAALVLPLVSSNGQDKPKKTIAVDIRKLPPPSDRQGLTYAADIKPILDESCVKCHGAEKPKAKLRLDSLEGTLKGGENGKVIDSGHSASSVLVINVSHLGDPDDYMPPPNNKAKIGPLTKDQIGLIRAWIDQGAK